MKQGRTLVDLAAEIERQRDAKADFVADTRKLRFVANGHGPRLEVEGHGEYGITEHAHRQIGERIGIPSKYYDRMLVEAPHLLEQNVNHWFENDPERRMVRTLDGEARAFLSERFRPMDNHDLAEAVLPVLRDAGASVESCEITPSRMYIKGVVDGVREVVPPPEGNRQTTPLVVSPGLVISNSEVGMGALAIQPAVHFLSCTNMAVWAQHALRKYHVGRVLSEGPGGSDDVWQFLSSRTKELSDAALWSSVRDLAWGALQGNVFNTIVRDLRAARSEPVVNVTGTVEKLGERKGLVEHERASVLHYLIEGGDLSKFGLSNAVTRYSQDVEGYDRATYLEQLGGEVIALPRTEWEVITT